MVLLRAHRLRCLAHGARQVGPPCRAEARRPVFRWKLLIPLMLYGEKLASRQPSRSSPRSPDAALWTLSRRSPSCA